MRETVAGCRVLCVDDDETMRRSMACVGRRSLRVWTASDSLEARRIASEHELDIAMIDLKLFGESGLPLSAWLRVRQPRVGISIVTGERLTPELVMEAMEHGADDFMCKPFTLEDLYESLAARRAKQLSRVTTFDENAADYCRHVLGLCNGNKSKAARVANIGRAAFVRRLDTPPPRGATRSAR